MMHERCNAWLRALGRAEKLAIVRAREKAEKTLGANGADGIGNIEGKVARVATSKLGNERVSNSTSALSTMQCSSLARYRCRLLANAFGVVTSRIDRFIAEGGTGPYPHME
jgi:hypothetical protein